MKADLGGGLCRPHMRSTRPLACVSSGLAFSGWSEAGQRQCARRMLPNLYMEGGGCMHLVHRQRQCAKRMLPNRGMVGAPTVPGFG